MRIEHCKFVLAVAENGNLRKTAERHYITQQGLSQIIKSVERSLDTQIFMRTGSGLVVTEAGRIVLDKMQRIVEEYERMLDELAGSSQSAKLSQAPLTIYATPNVVNSVLPKILTSVHRISPRLMLSIKEDLPLDITDNAEFPAGNLGIITIPDFLMEESSAVKSGELIFEECARGPLMAYVSSSSPLAELPCITREMLAETPLAIYPSELNMVKHLLGPNGPDPNILVSAANFTLFRNPVIKNQAMGLTTVLFEKHVKSQPITLVPLEKPVDILWGCIYSGAKNLGYWEKEIITLARNTLQSNQVRTYKGKS